MPKTEDINYTRIPQTGVEEYGSRPIKFRRESYSKITEGYRNYLQSDIKQEEDDTISTIPPIDLGYVFKDKIDLPSTVRSHSYRALKIPQNMIPIKSTLVEQKVEKPTTIISKNPSTVITAPKIAGLFSSDFSRKSETGLSPLHLKLRTISPVIIEQENARPIESRNMPEVVEERNLSSQKEMDFSHMEYSEIRSVLERADEKEYENLLALAQKALAERAAKASQQLQDAQMALEQERENAERAQQHAEAVRAQSIEQFDSMAANIASDEEKAGMLAKETQTYAETTQNYNDAADKIVAVMAMVPGVSEPSTTKGK